jgi:hypothetical protein
LRVRDRQQQDVLSIEATSDVGCDPGHPCRGHGDRPASFPEPCRCCCQSLARVRFLDPVQRPERLASSEVLARGLQPADVRSRRSLLAEQAGRAALGERVRPERRDLGRRRFRWFLGGEDDQIGIGMTSSDRGPQWIQPVLVVAYDSGATHLLNPRKAHGAFHRVCLKPIEIARKSTSPDENVVRLDGPPSVDLDPLRAGWVRSAHRGLEEWCPWMSTSRLRVNSPP